MAPTKLDVRGEICPYPMMRTVSALKKLSSDDTALEVVTDHAPALETIPTQAARLGFRTEIEETGASEWRLLITRTEAEA
jgi:tRNA 2-thiouridine synthesizing protein A